MNLPSALRGGRMVHGAHFRRQRWLRGVFALQRRGYKFTLRVRHDDFIVKTSVPS